MFHRKMKEKSISMSLGPSESFEETCINALIYTYQERSGANFSARIAAFSDNSSRIAKSAVLRY